MLKRGVTINHLVFIIFHFMILIGLLFFSYISIGNYYIYENWSRAISNLAILLLIIQLISFRLKGVEYTDFRLWFISLTYLFMFGRIILNGYGLDGELFWNIINRYPKTEMIYTSLVILCLIQSIFIGFMFEDTKYKVREIYKRPKNILMFETGIILFAFSTPFRLYVDIKWVLQAQQTGSFSELVAETGLANDFAFLFVPSLIFIIVSGKLKRKSVLFVILFIIFYFIAIMILTGDRRYPVTAILSLLLCYLKLYDVKLKLSNIFLLIIGSSFLLNLLATIRNIRQGNLTSVSDFFATYGSDLVFGMSTLYETLAEFGLTFFSVVHIVQFVPDFIPYQFGFTFLASIPSVFPIGWLASDFFDKASLSNIINPIVGRPVGASLIGDLYGNFGWFSILVGIVFGLIGSKIFRLDNTKDIRLKCAQYYTLFYILINLVRATFFEIFRASIWVYFIPLIIIFVLRKGFNRY